jgi:hypothetical protein
MNIVNDSTTVEKRDSLRSILCLQKSLAIFPGMPKPLKQILSLVKLFCHVKDCVQVLPSSGE